MIELLSAITGILLVDLALSGDNALVIGAAAAGLPRRQRWTAILLGGAGSVVLRVTFAFIASFLLLLPWLQAIGGCILLIIAIRLLMDQHAKQPALSKKHTRPHPSNTRLQSVSGSGVGARLDPYDKAGGKSGRLNAIWYNKAATTQRVTARSILSALLTILVADVTMSLDNVLAVGALSHGDFLVLSLGILISIIILLIGSALVAEVMKWLPWLLDVAALVLAWTGANMVLHDLRLGDILNDYAWTAIAVPAVSISIVLLADVLLRLRGRKLARQV